MLAADESALVGAWLLTNNKVVADANCVRISALLSQLHEVSRTDDGWTALYRDPLDDRLWELTYPESHLQGGGPPALHFISREAAAVKYGHGV